MDDDLDLLRDPDGEGDPGGEGDPDGEGAPIRRPWHLVAAAVVVALVVVSGLVWVVGSLVGGDTGIRPAAASPTVTTPAPTTTRPPAPTGTVAGPSPTPRPIPPIRGPVLPSPTPAPTRPTLPPPSPRPLLVRVPDVTGQRLTSATLTLRAAGFRVSVLGAFGPAPKPDSRRVTSQWPTGGSLAPKGSTVVLILDSS